MKKIILVVALCGFVTLIAMSFKSNPLPQNSVPERFNTELYGKYKNVNPHDDNFKLLILDKGNFFQRTDKDPENLESAYPKKTIKGTWQLDLNSLELGALIHFKDPNAHGCYADIAFGYRISHDTLLLAIPVFGFSDWNRPYVLKKVK